MRLQSSPMLAAAIAAGAAILCADLATAQHSHTITVTSNADGGGALGMSWNFAGLPIARTTDSGLPGIFTGNIPGLNDGAGNGVSTFPLIDGTDVDVELMAIDDGLRWIFSGTPVQQPGDQALVGTMPDLHNHATFEQTTTDANTFAEGRISFRVVESTDVPFGYAPSEVRTLIVSNGYLSPLSGDSKAEVNCQKTIASSVRQFSAKTYQRLGACMDAVYAHTLLGKSVNPVLKKCSLDGADAKSLVGRIAGERAKALAKIDKKCGPLGSSSLPYSLSQIQTHLGMAQCRAAEMAGATYNRAVTRLGAVLQAEGAGNSTAVQNAFPCMQASYE